MTNPETRTPTPAELNAPTWWLELPHSACVHPMHGAHTEKTRTAMMNGYFYYEIVCEECGARWRGGENQNSPRAM